MVCGDNPTPFRIASNSEVKAKTEEEATVIAPFGATGVRVDGT